ncbi:MAG: flippase [Candidatus Bathyarchaeia archaeon]|jgi:O-antigen/teichoic acid export membrane protein
MSKATDMAKVSAKGGFHLLWGLVVSTVISAVGTIVIARLLGSDNMGLYSIAVAAPNLIATFRDWGVNTAMIKYSAQYNSENDSAKIRSIFISGFIFELILGLILAVFAISISGFLADMFQRPQIAQLIQITSIFILTGGLVNTATAAFTGMEKMHLNSIMLIIQSLVKTGLIILLVFFGLGTLGATIGYTVAVAIAAITGVLLTYTIYASLPKSTDGKLAIGETTKALLKYGLPLSIGSILSGFLTQFYSWIMAIFVTDNGAIGNYSVATNFVVLITFFATPVTTMLLPAFSKLDYKKEYQDLKNIFQYSVKYAALIVLPVTTLVMSLSQPAIGTLFEDSYPLAPLFLTLLSLNYFFSAFGSLSIGNLINSQGDTKYNLILTIVSVVIGFPLSFLLVSQFGIVGLIITTTVVGIPGLVWSLGFIKKRYGIEVDWGSSAKILFSAGLTGILTYLFVSWLPFSDLIRLLLGVVAFAVVFLVIAVVTRTITRSDITLIRQIVGGLGPLRKPLTLVLNLLEKLMSK